MQLCCCCGCQPHRRAKQLSQMKPDIAELPARSNWPRRITAAGGPSLVVWDSEMAVSSLKLIPTSTTGRRAADRSHHQNKETGDGWVGSWGTKWKKSQMRERAFLRMRKSFWVKRGKEGRRKQPSVAIPMFLCECLWRRMFYLWITQDLSRAYQLHFPGTPWLSWEGGRELDGGRGSLSDAASFWLITSP